MEERTQTLLSVRPRGREAPIRESVSVSCTSCPYTDYGRFDVVEPSAQVHAQAEEHHVDLLLGLTKVGTWAPSGKFQARQ